MYKNIHNHSWMAFWVWCEYM